MSNQAMRLYRDGRPGHTSNLDHHEEIKDALDFVRAAIGRKTLHDILSDEMRTLDE